MPAQRSDTPRRINVAVNEQMLNAFDLLIAQEEITLTEAVRRLVQYGDFIYRAVRQDGCDLLLRQEDGTMREIVLV